MRDLYISSGVAMKVRVIRHGVEQKTTMKDDYYDFNYQNPILLTDPAEIWPVREHFPTYCSYFCDIFIRLGYSTPYLCSNVDSYLSAAQSTKASAIGKSVTFS